ncbi:MAG: transporter substrate-binding domain-containing protein, partial [Verrucomicrobiota bacterium]
MLVFVLAALAGRALGAEAPLLIGSEIAPGRQQIRIGLEYNSPPLSYLSKPGQPEGFTVDLLRELDDISPVDFEFVVGSWKSIEADFKAGKIDALANIVITDERLKSIEFSIGHASTPAIVYSRPGEFPITRLAQLPGKTLAVLSGTALQRTALNHNGWGARVVVCQSYADMLAGVKRGDCDLALVMRALRSTEADGAKGKEKIFYQPNAEAGHRSQLQTDELELQRGWMEDLVSEYHIGFHRGDKERLRVINEGLATLRSNGTFDRLSLKWLGHVDPHPITLNDLRPYYLEMSLAVVVLVGIYAWQRSVYRRLRARSEDVARSQSFLERMGQVAAIGAWELDAATMQLVWSLEVWRIHELDPSTALTIDQTIAYFSAEVRPAVQAALAAALEHGTSFDLEVPLVTAKGRRIWVRTVGVAAREEGKVVRLSGALQEITAQKQSEDRMRTLSRIVSQSPLSTIITDLSGTIEYVNPKFCAVTQYTLPEVIGRNTNLLKSGQMAPEVYRDLWQTITSGKTWSGDLFSKTKDGRIILESAVLAPVLDESGRTTHYVAMKDDVTAQKRREAEDQMVLAKEREISAMKSRFIVVTSHEFRTPMATAMGSAEILHHHIEKLAPEKREELFGRVNGALRRMSEMLDELLLMNRLEAERVEAQLASLELGPFLRNVLKEIQLGDREAHRFEISVAGSSSAFVSDAKMLHSIFANLIGNAVRYSPAGTLVTVRLVVDATRAQVEVADQGIGVPPADRARIFEPFERGSNIGTIRGTGLGLNIVKRLVRLLGGQIEVAAAEGGGSRFTVVLPRPAVVGAPPPPPPPPRFSPRGGAGAGGGVSGGGGGRPPGGPPGPGRGRGGGGKRGRGGVGVEWGA